MRYGQLLLRGGRREAASKADNDDQRQDGHPEHGHPDGTPPDGSPDTQNPVDASPRPNATTAPRTP